MATNLNQRSLTTSGLVMTFVVDPKELKSARQSLANLLGVEYNDIAVYASGSVDLGDPHGIVELNSYVERPLAKDENGKLILEQAKDSKGKPRLNSDGSPQMIPALVDGPLPAACVQVMTIGKNIALRAEPPSWDGDTDIDALADHLPVDTTFELVIPGHKPTIGQEIKLPARIWGNAPENTDAKPKKEPKAEKAVDPRVATLQSEIKTIMAEHKAASDKGDQKEVNRQMDKLRFAMGELKKLNAELKTKSEGPKAKAKK